MDEQFITSWILISLKDASQRMGVELNLLYHERHDQINCNYQEFWHLIQKLNDENLIAQATQRASGYYRTSKGEEQLKKNLEYFESKDQNKYYQLLETSPLFSLQERVNVIEVLIVSSSFLLFFYLMLLLFRNVSITVSIICVLIMVLSFAYSAGSLAYIVSTKINLFIKEEFPKAKNLVKPVARFVQNHEILTITILYIITVIVFATFLDKLKFSQEHPALFWSLTTIVPILFGGIKTYIEKKKKH